MNERKKHPPLGGSILAKSAEAGFASFDQTSSGSKERDETKKSPPMQVALEQYAAAKIELLLIEAELRRSHTVTDTVKGSLTEHPYTLTTIRITGIELDVEEMLKSRLHKLAALRARVEHFLATVDDPYMASLLRLRYVEGLPWEGVADRMGSSYTGGSLKVAVHRFLKTCKACNTSL